MLDSTDMEVPPLLVQVLGGNVVTAVSVLACLTTADATVLRRLHPALAAGVAAVPWTDTNTPVHDMDRWRAALPAATALKLAAKVPLPLHHSQGLAALGGVTDLDLGRCSSATDAVIAHLPSTLRSLNVLGCAHVTQHVSFTHLSALELLDCSGTKALEAGLASLPPSLRELRMRGCEVPDAADFSHLRHLRVVTRHRGWEQHVLSAATVASLPPSLEVLDVSEVMQDSCRNRWRSWSLARLTRLCVLKVSRTTIDDAALAKLPQSLRVLDLEYCTWLSSAASFAHLTCLHTLNLRDTLISDEPLATLPPSLVSLTLPRGVALTPATVLPHLPALRVLDMSHSKLDDAAVASMPAGLEELHIVCCPNVTRGARPDPLVALGVREGGVTNLSPATISACRARGCFAPSDGNLVPTSSRGADLCLPLPDGRLVSGSFSGYVALWEEAGVGCIPVAQLVLHCFVANALAVLHDGHRVVVGVRNMDFGRDGIVVWDTREAPHDRRVVTRVTIACTRGVRALAVAHNDWVVVGGREGELILVDVDAGAVVATLGEGGRTVLALAVLLDGRVACATTGGRIKLWDVTTRACVLTLEEHCRNCFSSVCPLVVLSDGRLASGSDDKTVRLWDTATGTCIRVLTGHTQSVSALAVLPGNQLASVSADGTIRVWDTRDDAHGAGGALARPPCVIAYGSTIPIRTPPTALLPLPGNRLASSGEGCGLLWQLPPHAT